MSKIEIYEKKRQELERIQKELEKLESSDELKKEMQFKNDLEKLMDKYSKDAKEVLRVLGQIDPNVSSGSSAGTGTRRSRPLMKYKNPHTGEVVKTKGGNHKTLKAWREQYGKEEVDKWKQPA